MTDLKLFSFFWDCGRMGSLEGLFFATREEINAAFGSDIYFGEVLGKHSEVYGTLNPTDIDEMNVSSDVALALYEAVGTRTVSGYNPLEYLDEDEDD